MRGPQRFLRRSTSFLWWGGLGAFLLLFLMTVAWIILNPKRQVLPLPGPQLLVPILGPRGMALFWLLTFLGGFTCVLGYLLIFSRVFLLVARQGYLPRALAELTQAGTPRRAILAQSAMVACAAVLLFVIVPMLLRLFLSADLVDALFSGDQYGLATSLAGSLWCGFLALLFGFALWLCWKKRRRTQLTHLQRLLLSLLCVASGLSSLACMVAPLLPSWPVLFFSHNRWFALVLLVVNSVNVGSSAGLVNPFTSLQLERVSFTVQSSFIRKKLA